MHYAYDYNMYRGGGGLNGVAGKFKFNFSYLSAYYIRNTKQSSKSFL